MKITLLLFAVVAAVTAQSVDTVSATASGVCEPHGDHWHCPSGVPKPTTPPAVAASLLSSAVASVSQAASSETYDHDHAVSATTCEPHGDHWHCPSGVPKPSTTPAAVNATSTRATTTTRAASVSQATGAAVKVALGAQDAFVALAGALGAWLL